MPYIAINEETGKRVDISAIKEPRLTLKSGKFICQLCQEPLFIKSGLIRRAHFCHYGDCNTDYQYHPESAEHLEAKSLLIGYLKTNFMEYSSAHFELEVPIPEIKRVADILVSFPMGWRVAHEIQLAPITVEELNERTRSYLGAGIDVVWWLGKSADTTANRIWCEREQGFSLQVYVIARNNGG